MRAPIVWTMIFSMTLMPVQSAFAGPDGSKSGKEQVRLQNVELNEKGQVKGRLLDEKGSPLTAAKVEIRIGKESKRVVTDRNGSFTVENKAGGNCAIIVDKQAYACRLWKQNTAPPKAMTSFNIVHHSDPIVRGQYDDCGEGCDDGGCGRLGKVSGGQLLGLGLLAGAVVAIVIAVDDDDDAS